MSVHLHVTHRYQRYVHNIRGDTSHWDINRPRLDYSAPILAFLTVHRAGGGLLDRKLIICAWHAKLPESSYLMLKRELYLGDDGTLEQALRTDWKTLTLDNLGMGLYVNVDNDTTAHQHDDTFYTEDLRFSG